MSAGDRRFTFPEREYYRRCAMCGFVADPGYPWEEKLQTLEYCPSCSIPLERLACQACGAPVVMQSGMTIFGGRHHSAATHCGYCGEPVTRAEPKLRTKPVTKPAEPTPDDPFKAQMLRYALTYGAGKYGASSRPQDQHPQGGYGDGSDHVGRQKPIAGCGCDVCEDARDRAGEAWGYGSPAPAFPGFWSWLWSRVKRIFNRKGSGT